MVPEPRRLAPLDPLGGDVFEVTCILRRPRALRPMSPTPAPDSACVGHQLRDGVLQDFRAVSMLIETARRDLRLASVEEHEGHDDQQSASSRVEVLLERTALTLQTDIATVREVIDRIRRSA